MREHLSPATMADPVDQICNELGVCREEAFFYLEGFRWDLQAATEACRSKTLPSPSLPVQSSPEALRTLPLMPGSNHPPDPEEELRRNEQILTFCEVALGATVDDARLYLSHYNWNSNVAVDAFMSETRPTASDRNLSSPPFSNDGRTTVSQSSPQMSLGNDMMQDVLNRVPQFRNNVKGVSIRNNSSSSTAEEDPMETVSEDEGPSKDLRREYIKQFLDVATGASLPAALNSLNACKWDVQDALAFFFKEATPEIASSQVHESGSPTQTAEENLSPASEESAETPSDPQTQLYNEEFITSFQEAIGVTRQAAIDYLTLCDWNVNKAVDFFLDGYRVEKSSAGKFLSLPKNRDVPLPSQSQFEASYVSQSQDYLKEGGTGSSSSRIYAPSTETQRSLEEAGQGDVTVALPGKASYQVDAVEEESSKDPLVNQDRTVVGTQTAQDTITITIVLADDGSGTSLVLPFRSNQTVRDIRNAIDERTPDNDRGYFLQSMTGVECTDLNLTVYRISTGGSATLLQIFPDP